MQESVAHAVALHDRRGARRGRVGTGAGVWNAECVEPSDGGGDGGIAIVHVVGDADHADAGGAQRLATDQRRGEEAFVFRRVPVRGIIEAAFEIAEHDVGGAELLLHACERHRGIVDVHQVDVAGEDHLGHQVSCVCEERSYEAISIIAAYSMGIASSLRSAQ